MEEQIKLLNEQIKNLSNNSMEEQIKLLTEQIKNLNNEIISLKNNMVTKSTIKIKVVVKNHKNQKVLRFYIDQSDNIKSIKSQIEEKENLPIQKQQLYFNDKLLEDDEAKVKQCDITDKSTLRLVKEDDDDYENFCALNLLNMGCKGVSDPNIVFDHQFFIDSLKNNVSKKIKTLLYSATKDGDTANVFHQKCDNQGPLLYFIITKENAVFGIYVSKPISSNGNSYTDSTQMVICPSKKFAVKSKNDNATYHCYPDKGATFHCMQINAPFLSSSCNDIQSCDNFELPSYPSGNSSYQIKELLVFSLEDCA